MSPSAVAPGALCLGRAPGALPPSTQVSASVWFTSHDMELSAAVGRSPPDCGGGGRPQGSGLRHCRQSGWAGESFSSL